MALLTAVQFKPIHKEVSLNLTRILTLCEEAAQKGAKLVQLPEMCLTGYLFADKSEILPLAEEKEGPSFQVLSAKAKELGIHLCYGYAERCQEQGELRLYNSQNLIDEKGRLIGHYRKRHLFQADLPWAEEGNLPFQCIQTSLGRIGLGICMDLNFDDFVLYHHQARTEILCLAVNWLHEGGQIHPYWIWRLAGFPETCLFANSYGWEGKIRFCGQSAVYHQGKILQSAELEGEALLLFDRA